jgi:hypothetical protein
MKRTTIFYLIAISIFISATATADDPPKSDAVTAVEKASTRARHQFDKLAKRIDDVLWYERVGDVAVIDKCRIYGPPRWKEKNPTSVNAGNHVKFYTYLFTPKGFDAGSTPISGPTTPTSCASWWRRATSWWRPSTAARPVTAAGCTRTSTTAASRWPTPSPPVTGLPTTTRGSTPNGSGSSAGATAV